MSSNETVRHPVPGHSGRIYVCDRCGSRMVERQCKISCPNCGNRFDCSDLSLYFDEFWDRSGVPGDKPG